MEQESCWVYPVNGPHFLSKPWKTFTSYASFIITDIIKAMDERDGYTTSGILREKEENAKIEERMASIDNGLLRKYPETDTPKLISSVFKKYVKGICEIDPLLEDKQIKPLFDNLYTGNFEIVKQMLSEIEESKLVSLSFIFYFLKKITLHPESLMDANNVGVCCAPVLFPLSDHLMIVTSAKLIEQLLINFDNIFDPEWYSEKRIISDDGVLALSMPYVDQYDLQIEAERREIRKESKIPVDYEYIDALFGLKYPDSDSV